MHPRIPRPTQLSNEKRAPGCLGYVIVVEVQVQVQVVVLVLRSSTNGTSSWSLRFYETDAC